MRIGFLTPEYTIPGDSSGGLARYIQKTASALAARGHAAVVFVQSQRNAKWMDGPVIIHECRTSSRMLHTKVFNNRFTSLLIPAMRQIMASKYLAHQVWLMHKEAPFDVLQASSYMAPGFALLRNGRIPLVCRISSYTPLWRSAYGRQRRMDEYLSDWLEVRQVVDADAAFAPSDLLARTFVRMEGYSPYVIRTPVEACVAAVNWEYLGPHFDGRPYMLYFGQLSRIKGVDLLAEALPAVLKQYSNLLMVFVGRDDGLPSGQSMAAHLLEQCEESRERIIFHRPLSKEQLMPIVANAVGVLMPSRVDNYPNACLEALSSGTPVVGTYDSSLDEMIIDGETGFLAKNDNPGDLQRAMLQLLQQTPAERQKMKERIAAYTQSLLLEDPVGQLVDLYKLVTEGSRGGRG